MIVTVKALAALLSYPGAELQRIAPDVTAILREENLLSAQRLNDLAPLLHELASHDVYDLQERFVHLFDRSRTLSLNLFEHVHGDSRARGTAMVDLLETYRAAGFEPMGPELPDHLPILLEYLSQCPLAEARDTLADAAHIFVSLAERLDRRHSSYSAVFRALVDLAAATASAELIAQSTAAPDDDPDDFKALDAVWEEAMVTFGPDPNAGCPAGRDILARMTPPRPAPGAN